RATRWCRAAERRKQAEAAARGTASCVLSRVEGRGPPSPAGERRWPSPPEDAARGPRAGGDRLLASGEGLGRDLVARILGRDGAVSEILEGMRRIPCDRQALRLRAGRREGEDQRFGAVMRD